MKKVALDKLQSNVIITIDELSALIPNQTEIQLEDWKAALKLMYGIKNNEKVTFKGHTFWGPYYAPGEILSLALTLINHISDSELRLSLPIGVSNISLSGKDIYVTGNHEIIDRIEANILMVLNLNRTKELSSSEKIDTCEKLDSQFKSTEEPVLVSEHEKDNPELIEKEKLFNQQYDSELYLHSEEKTNNKLVNDITRALEKLTELTTVLEDKYEKEQVIVKTNVLLIKTVTDALARYNKDSNLNNLKNDCKNAIQDVKEVFNTHRDGKVKKFLGDIIHAISTLFNYWFFNKEYNEVQHLKGFFATSSRTTKSANVLFKFNEEVDKAFQAFTGEELDSVIDDKNGYN